MQACLTASGVFKHQLSSVQGSWKVLGVPKYPVSTLKIFGSTSLPLEVQHKAATTPDNFGSESAHKIRSPLSGHLSLESTRQMQNLLTFERFLTIHFAY
jgi:hypothetical protein